MNLLAFEFSSEQRSVALLQSSLGQSPTPIISSIRTSPRTLNAFSLIESVLKQAKLKREEIDRLAVGLGPGSYTGIRAAISIAQGWQLARDIHLLGLSSIESIACQARAEGILGSITVIVDAQRNEFYLARYEISAAALRPLEPLRLASFAEVEARAKAGETLIGPEADHRIPGARPLFPNAGALAELAANRTDFIKGENLQPIYLRETAFVKAPPPRQF